jgi:hypothetical protein
VKLVLAGAVAGALLCSARLPAQAPESRPSPLAVDDAIEKGVAWLLRAQEPDGSWRGPEPELYRGMTALAAYTVVKCDRAPDHPAVRAAVASLRSWPIERTYDLGCALMLLHALGDGRPADLVKQLADRLLATVSNGRKSRGMRWGYPNDRVEPDDSHTDLSNTQYAVLGLRAARLSGYKAGSPLFWGQLAKDLLDEQHPYGGFGYERGEKPSASMTVAGITMLSVCEEAIGAPSDLDLAKRIKAGMDSGFRWLDTHWSVEHMIDLRVQGEKNDRWLLYYLYGLERLGAFTARDAIGSHRWYDEGAAHLVKKQKPDGSWDWGDSDTCFALLFLNRGSRTSGPSPRQRRESGEGAAAAFAVATDGRNPLRAWVRGVGPELSEKLAQGLALLSLSWLVDGVPVATIPGASETALSGEAFHLKHALATNGAHRILARLSLRRLDGAEEWVDSNVATVAIDDVEEPRHREAIRDTKKNLLWRARAKASGSSSIDLTRAPARALDGQYGTAWLCARADADPWIQVTLQGDVRATVLKLASGGNTGAADDAYARPKDVEIAINGGDPIAVRLEDTARRKQSLRIEPTAVRSVHVRIRSVYGGRPEATATGFKEIELHDVPADGPAAADLLVPATRAEAIVPSARAEAVRWRYTFEAPPAGWLEPGFADGGWKEGEAGFGTLPNAVPPPRTAWKSREIWIRRVFTLPKGEPGDLAVELNHDDDAEVFVNGVLVASEPKFSAGGYRTLALPEAARASLRPGQNVIAAHCTNPAGPGFLDVALVRLVRR